jgi:general secretion pathway protein F
MRDRFAVLINRIRDGVGLSEAFKVSEKGSTLVSPLIIRFLKLSEQTGNMRKLIPQAAAQHHNQLYRQVETCIAWLEPALILVMGGFMLWIVLAVMVPFYSLLEDVNV